MRLRLGVEGVRHGSGQPRRTANECVGRRVAQMVVLPSKFRPRNALLSSRTRTHAKKASRTDLVLHSMNAEGQLLTR